MKRYYKLYFTLTALLLVLSNLSFGANMKGKIIDKSTKQPMYGVTIINIHTNRGTMTDSSGTFDVTVAAGELVEITKFGYQTIRIRIPKGELPKYYMLDMDIDYFDLDGVDIFGTLTEHVRDSIKKAEVYRNQLDLPTMSGFDMVQHPFSALSKRNRQIWAFQKHFEHWEKDKFVDYVFNDDIIMQLTGIEEKDLLDYKRYYRPSYEFIKSLSNDYEYYEYLKYSGKEFIYNKYNRK